MTQTFSHKLFKQIITHTLSLLFIVWLVSLWVDLVSQYKTKHCGLHSNYNVVFSWAKPWCNRRLWTQCCIDLCTKIARFFHTLLSNLIIALSKWYLTRTIACIPNCYMRVCKCSVHSYISIIVKEIERRYPSKNWEKIDRKFLHQNFKYFQVKCGDGKYDQAAVEQ